MSMPDTFSAPDDDEEFNVAQSDFVLPPPKPASSHVAQFFAIPARPRQDITISGEPHPAHRAR